MSAYLVEPSVVGFLADEILRNVLIGGNTQPPITKLFLIKVLTAQNLRSLMYRYPDCGTSLGEVMLSWTNAETTHEEYIALAMAGGPPNCGWSDNNCVGEYQYQACETPDWRETLSYKLTEALKASPSGGPVVF